MSENEIRPPALRGAVIVFSQRMEIILREHDYKGGWVGCSPGWLIDRIGQELREVRRAYRHWVDFRDFQNTTEDGKLTRELQRELTDVANFCMMASDVLDNARKAKDLREMMRPTPDCGCRSASHDGCGRYFSTAQKPSFGDGY